MSNKFDQLLTMNNLQFNLDKIAGSIEEGSLKEFLKQEKNRRELRKRNRDEFNSKELNQAYSYYWRKMKEFESLELREQLEKTFELYIDLCNRFDPLSYGEIVWEYMDVLDPYSPEGAEDEFPPYSSVTEVDSESNYYLSQAKMLYLYNRMCEKLKYLVKMVRKRGGVKRVEEAARGAGCAKNVFAEAVKETMEESVASIEDYEMPPEEDDATCDYLEGSNCKLEENPKEEWEPDETYVLQEYEFRKTTELSSLHLKVGEYLYEARCILEEQKDKEGRYKALGVLWDDIDKENGGYVDDRARVPDEEDLYKIGVKTGLIEPVEKMRRTDVLRNYLDRVEKVTGAGENVTNTGWSWEPAERLYPAVVVLYWLRYSIREEMRNLHRQMRRYKDVEKHRFAVHGCWEKKIDWASGTVKMVYEEKQGYETDEDLDRPDLPRWITGEQVEEMDVDKKPEEEKPEEEKPEEGKQEINSIPISQDKARKLFRALSNERVGWLSAPIDEDEFVNVLMHKPAGRRIKLKKLCQVRHVTKKHLFPDKKLKHSEWELIKQLFEAENGTMGRVEKANKPPENSEILDKMMDE